MVESICDECRFYILDILTGENYCEAEDDDECPMEALANLEAVKPCPKCDTDMDGHGSICPNCGYVWGNQ